MTEILTGGFASPNSIPLPRTIRVVDWNIARGVRLATIIDVLAAQQADLLILQECDCNARRTGHRNITAAIAKELGMNYVFGQQFQELVEGSPSSPAYIGQATLCRWPLRNPRVIRFQRQSSFWQPRWWVPRCRPFEVRLGGRIALVTDVNLPDSQPLVVYNLHLESRGGDTYRSAQLNEVLGDAQQLSPQTPVLVAGDFNLDTSAQGPAQALQRAGFTPALNLLHGAPTTPRILGILPGWSIDQAFVRGPMQTSGGEVLRSARGSDHYPLAFTLELHSPPAPVCATIEIPPSRSRQ